MGLKDFFNKIASKFGKRLDIPVEVMSSSRLHEEIKDAVKRIEETQKLDNRTERVLNRVFDININDKNFKYLEFSTLLKAAKDFELRKEILEKYASKVDFEDLHMLSNRYFSWESTPEQDELRTIIYTQNIERLDIEDIIGYENFNVFQKLYTFTSDKEKRRLMLESVLKSPRKTEEDLKEYIEFISSLPEDEKLYNVEEILAERKAKKVNSSKEKAGAKGEKTTLSDEVRARIDPDLLDYLTTFTKNPSIISYYDLIEDFEEFLSQDKTKTNLFFSIYERLKEIETYPEEHSQDLIKYLNRLDKEELESIDISNENDLDKALGIAFLKYTMLPDWNSVNKKIKFDEYDEVLKADCSKVIHNKLSSRVQLLDALGMRFFHMPYEKMRELVEVYGEDIDSFIADYKQKENLSDEEKSEFSALTVIRNFKEILQVEDKDAIIKTYEELDKMEEFDRIDYKSIVAFDETIRRVYAKDYKKDLYIPNNNDKKVIDGIEVYAPKEFNMFVHVVGAYGKFNLIDEKDPNKSAKTIWENERQQSKHILCTSRIKESSILTANILDESVILGFEDYGDNSVLMSSPADIYSFTNHMDKQDSGRKFVFRNSRNLHDNTRVSYNEVGMEIRREDDKTKKILPSYVVCFDKISEQSKKVANDFNVPIVFLDSKEIAIDQNKKLQEMIQNYNETKQPELLKDIVNLYQGNLLGLTQKRPDLAKKYFNVRQMNQTLNQIITDIKSDLENGNRENALDRKTVLHSTLKEEVRKFEFGRNIEALYSGKNIDVLGFIKKLDRVEKSKEKEVDDIEQGE